MDQKVFTARITNGSGAHLKEFGSTSSQGDADGQALSWVQSRRDLKTREHWDLDRENDPWWLEQKIDGTYQRLRQLEF